LDSIKMVFFSFCSFRCFFVSLSMVAILMRSIIIVYIDGN
jgi:hypothetical protein